MLRFKRGTEFKRTEIGEVPKEWEIWNLRDLFKIETGKRPPEINNNGKFEVWGAKGFMGYTCSYNYCGEFLITGRVGTLGYVFYIPKNIKIWASDNALIITKNKDKKTIVKFYFYHLETRKEEIEELNVGSTQPLITQRDLKEIKVPYPPPTEQSRIATVLSWFDDLIENKKRQNEILEKTAMAIFKSWFVDFEPFKDEEFVYNEGLDREVPKGWEVKPIGEVAEFIKGLSYHSNELVDNPTEGEIFITLKIFKRGGGFRSEYKYYRGNRYSDEQVVYDGDLVIALTDMTSDAKVVGAPALVILPPNKDKGILSLDAAKLNVPQYMKGYIYLYLKDSQEENSTFANGVNVLHLNLNLFKSGKFILIPPYQILQHFHLLVEPLFQKIILNQKQIMGLRKVRDALLPQLVFGKLRVVEL